MAVAHSLPQVRGTPPFTAYIELGLRQKHLFRRCFCLEIVSIKLSTTLSVWRANSRLCPPLLVSDKNFQVKEVPNVFGHWHG